MNSLASLWGYPLGRLFASTSLTLGVYGFGIVLYKLGRRAPLLHPGIVGIILVVAVLTGLGVEYTSYFRGAQPIHLLLGPATVALGVPLYHHLSHLRERWLPLLAALLVGGSVAAGSAMLIAWILGGDPLVIRSLASKSVTTPIATVIAAKIGGLPSLAAAVVLATGIFGGLIAPPLFRLLRINDPITQGFSLGVAAHAFGTAKALEIHPAAGAFAALGLCLCGVVTAVLLPLIFQWLAG